MVVFLYESTDAWYTDSKTKRLDISFYWKCRFLSLDVILARVRYTVLLINSYHILI